LDNFETKKIKYGYVAIKFDSWHGVGGNEKTDRWKSINNERARRLRLSSNGDENNELLASNPTHELSRSRLEWTIDGNVTSLNHAEFLELFQHTQRVVELMSLVSLMKDPDYTGGEEKTHIYYT
jgi:hypothetical protein